MAKVEPKFDFTQNAPQESEGQFHTDGALGTAAKGSATAKHNRMKAPLFNEYERVMHSLADAVGDHDFIDIFPGTTIQNVSDAVRRAKQEIDSILAVLESAEDEEQVDRRYYGILTNWVHSGRNNPGSIKGQYYAPGIEGYEYEPSFEIINITGRVVGILGGTVRLPPDVELTVVPSTEIHGGFVFTVPDLEFSENDSFEFGVGMLLPASESNKVTITNGQFQIPIRKKPVNFAGKGIGQLENGRGAGAFNFEYRDLLGSNAKEVSIVAVAGDIDTETGDRIDLTEFFVAHMGINRFDVDTDWESPDYASIGYDMVIDPTTGLVKCKSYEPSGGGTPVDGLKEGGDYYIYFMVPESVVYSLQLNTQTRQLELESAFITDAGEIQLNENSFPLHLIKVQFDPYLATFGASGASASLFSYGRTSSSAEHSLGFLGLADSIIDVRQFQHKPKPLHTPPFMPKDYMELGQYKQVDIHGNENKVVPLFVPVEMTTRETLQAELEGSTVSSEAYVIRSNRDNIFDQVRVFSQDSIDITVSGEGKDLDSFQPREHYLLEELNSLFTGSKGIDIQVLGIYATITVNDIVVTDLQSTGTKIKAFIESIDGDTIWDATTYTPGDLYSWDVDVASEKTVTSLESLQVNITLENDPSEITDVIEISEIHIILSPMSSKALTTTCGMEMKYNSDWETGLDIEKGRITFNSDGTFNVTRSIPKLEERYYSELWESKDPLCTSTISNVSTSLSAKPLWWKVETSMVNQYIIYLDANNEDIYIMRINIADPSINEEVQVEYAKEAGEEIPQWTAHDNKYSAQILDLEINAYERPTAIVTLKGTDGTGPYIRMQAVNYYQGIDNPKKVENLDTIYIDTSVYRLIGNHRSYDVDSAHVGTPVNMDRLDGRYLYFDSESAIRIVKIFPKVYINALGYQSYAEPVHSEHLLGLHFDYADTDRFLVYSENKRISKGNAGYSSNYGDGMIWSHTFALFDSVGRDVYIFSIKRDNSIDDIADGTTIVYEGTVGVTSGGLNSLVGCRQNNYIELYGTDGEDALGNPVKVMVQPYTGEVTSTIGSSCYDYEASIHYSLGTVIPNTDSWRDPSVDKYEGVRWADDNKEAYVEKYQTIADAIDSLYTKVGHSYLLGNATSDVYGFSRKLRPIRGGIETSVVHVRTYPSPVAVGSEHGIARRIGRYSRTGQGEVFFTLNDTGLDATAFNVTLLTANAFPQGAVDASYPYAVPLVGPLSSSFNDKSVLDERVPLIELGSVSGNGIDSGMYSSEITEDSYTDEYMHRITDPILEGSTEGVAKLGIHKEMNPIIVNDTEGVFEPVFGTDAYPKREATFRNITIPSDRNWSAKSSLIDPADWFSYSDGTVLLYEDPNLIEGDEVYDITSTLNDTEITIDRPIDIFSTGTKVFVDVQLVFHVDLWNMAGPTGTLSIEVYINDSTTASVTKDVDYKCFYTIYKGNRCALCITEPIADIGLSDKTLIKLAELPTPNLKIKKQIGSEDLSFALRRKDNDPVLSSIENEDSFWMNQFDIKLGNRSISEPGISLIEPPHKIHIGEIEEGKAVPFVGKNYMGKYISHGFVHEKTGRLNKIYNWTEWDWQEEEIPGSIHEEIAYAIETMPENNVIFSLLVRNTDDNKLYLVKKESLLWTRTEIAVDVPDLVSACQTLDNHIGYIYTSGSGLRIGKVNTATGVNITNLAIPNILDSPVSLKISEAVTGDLVSAMMISSGGSTYVSVAILASGGAAVNSFDNVTTISGTPLNPVINDIDIVMHIPYIVYSWKVEPEAEYVRTLRVDGFEIRGTGNDYLVSNISIVPDTNFEVTLDSANTTYPSFAFIGSPGYLVHQTAGNLQLKVKDEDVGTVDTSLRTQSTIVKTNNIAYFLVVEDNKLTYLGVWDIRFPYSESVYANTGYTDPIKLNEPFGLDPTVGILRINTPFYPYLTTTHLLRYLVSVPKEDIIIAENENKSAYSYRLSELRRLGTQIGTDAEEVERILELLEDVPKSWNDHTKYAIDDQVFIKTTAGIIELANAVVDHISGEDFSDDLSKWVMIHVSEWQEGRYYAIGSKVIKDDHLIICTGDHIADTDFNTQIDKWILANSSNLVWQSETLYWKGQLIYDSSRHILFRATNDHISSDINATVDYEAGKLVRVDDLTVAGISKILAYVNLI